MKKILAILLAVLLIAAMAVPAYAVTPKLEIPDIPDISKINFKVSLGEDFWERYWETHSIQIPTFNLPSGQLKERLQGLFD